MKAARIAVSRNRTRKTVLTDSQRSVEDGITGWENDTNATLSSRTDWAADGARSLGVVATARGDIIARTLPRTARAGRTSLKASITSQLSRQVQVGARFLDSGGAELSRLWAPLKTEASAITPLPLKPPGWPTFAGYTRLVISDTNYNLTLDPNTDYLVTFSGKVTKPVQLYQGRNIVCVTGGEIEIPVTYRAAGATINQVDTLRRGLYFNQPRGDVWFEGLHIHSPAGYLGDGVQINAASAKSFTFANCRLTDMRNTDGETFAAVNVTASAGVATRIYAGSPYAQNASATTGWHDITNNGTDPVQVATDQAISQNVVTIAAGATTRIDIPANTELWALGSSSSPLIVNSGGNHPDGIQCYGSRVDGVNIPFNLYNVHIETNYQGLFFQSTPVRLTMDRVVLIGNGRPKDGVFTHGILCWPDTGDPSLRTITNSYVVPVTGREYLETQYGRLPQAQVPGLLEAPIAPFDPAPAALVGLSYVSQGYANGAALPS